MVCPNCGAANDERDMVCRHCRTRLPPADENHAPEIRPSWDYTVISSCNLFPDDIIAGRFRIIKLLGQGGMGEIFMARDNESRGLVAIKSIRSAMLRDRFALARFRREAMAASLLNHPNICTIYEIARENEREYIIMEYVDGVTLGQLKKMKPLAGAQTTAIAMQIADGMIAAHEQHLVHLDIKPANIMIDKSGTVKILDFGLAEFRPRQSADRKTRRCVSALIEKDVILGTEAYMSPEQIEGQDLDGRSDIFSFGVVLFEMLAGVNPFSDRDSIVTLYNIIHKKVTLAQDVPPDLQKIVHKALQKDRERRYHDFGEIKKDLLAARATGK